MKFQIKLIVYLFFVVGIFQATTAFAQTTSPNSGLGPGASYNWSGYTAATGGNFSGVGATWVIPQPSNISGFSADAAWVGVGGISSSDLIQIGTQAIVSSSNQITYQAWYELLPGNSQIIPISVSQGDSITASIIQQSTGVWQISLRDNTNEQNFQTTVTYNSSLSSVEWIEEMPSQGSGGFIPLDNFGTISFTGAWANENGSALNLAQLSAQPMTMMNGSNQNLAVPSGINADGASFTVSRANAAVTPAVTVPYGRQGWHRVGVGVQGFQQFTRGRGLGLNMRRFAVRFQNFRYGRMSFGR